MSVPRIVFITCIIGEYEGFLKEPVAQSYPNTAFIAFVGQLTTLKCQENSIWNIVNASHHSSPEGFINSLDNNKHTFNVAKYYKCQAYKCPELASADIIVWLDGSVKITNPDCAKYLVEKIQGGSDMVAYKHEMRACYFQEALASCTDKRYNLNKWFNQYQPIQDVVTQAYTYYKEGCPVESGLWITCMLAYDARKESMRTFMDSWYREILTKTTQDQISFPFLVWKHKPNIYSLPDEKYTVNSAHFKTDMYDKYMHAYYPPSSNDTK